MPDMHSTRYCKRRPEEACCTTSAESNQDASHQPVAPRAPTASSVIARSSTLLRPREATCQQSSAPAAMARKAARRRSGNFRSSCSRKLVPSPLLVQRSVISPRYTHDTEMTAPRVGTPTGPKRSATDRVRPRCCHGLLREPCSASPCMYWARRSWSGCVSISDGR